MNERRSSPIAAGQSIHPPRSRCVVAQVGTLTSAEVDRIVAVAGERHPDEAQEGRPTATLSSPAADTAVYDRFVDVVALFAQQALGLRWFGNYAYGKVLEYPPAMGGVDWHADSDVNLTPLGLEVLIRQGKMERWQPDEMRGRTVSLMVQLSDPSSYTGGVLEFDVEDTIVTAPQERGAVIVASAATRHRVTPVESGTRLSLVVFYGWSPRGPARRSRYC
jgi:hypothetical protein